MDLDKGDEAYNPQTYENVLGIRMPDGIAAFGPFIVGVLLSMMAPHVFFWGCVVFFAFATALVWIYYARPNAPFPG